MLSLDACPKIPITMKQVLAMQETKVVPRGNLMPVYNTPITGFENVDSVDKKQEPVETHHVDVPVGCLFGIHSFGNMEVVNKGPGSTKVKIIKSDGSTAETMIDEGEKAFTFFEGRIAIVYLPADGDLPARVRIGFDRYFLSNFVALRAISVTVDGTTHTINFSCLEDFFQKVKALLTGNVETIDGALEQTSCPKLKKYMSTVSGIPDEWFKAPDGGETLAFRVMRYLQAWCPTCPTRFAFISELMKIAMDLGVSADNVEFCEYTDDANYGCKVVPGDFMPILAKEFQPKGKNFLGPVISEVARKVVELGTHGAYVEWFKKTYPPLFELKSDVIEEVTVEPNSIPVEEVVVVATVDEIPSLGTRLASEVDLDPPQGRTGSNGRTLSA